jgi:Ca2+-binding RTX toxin-like protein
MATVNGTGGNDPLNGTTNADDIHGGAGAEQMFGGTGDDTIFGGAGNDAIQGNDGTVLILAGAGGHNVAGGAGADTICGGSGQDTLQGNEDADTFIVQNDFGNVSVIGGETTTAGGSDFDTLDLSQITGNIAVTFTGPQSGTVTNGSFTLSFSAIERVMVRQATSTLSSPGSSQAPSSRSCPPWTARPATTAWAWAAPTPRATRTPPAMTRSWPETAPTP